MECLSEPYDTWGNRSLFFVRFWGVSVLWLSLRAASLKGLRGHGGFQESRKRKSATDCPSVRYLLSHLLPSTKSMEFVIKKHEQL